MARMGSDLKLNIVANLKNILFSSAFCTVCFETEDLLHLDFSYVFTKNLEEEVVTLRKIILAIFGNGDTHIFNYICGACKSNALSSFNFINRTKKTAFMYAKCLELLDKGASELTVEDEECKSAMFFLDLETLEQKAQQNTDLSSKNYDRKSDLVKHIEKQEVASKITCPDCAGSPCVHGKYLVAFQQQQMSKTSTTCIECGYKTGKTLPYLIAHANKKHLNIKNICDHCGNCFYLESHYKRHIKSHHNKRDGSLCSRTSRSTEHDTGPLQSTFNIENSKKLAKISKKRAKVSKERIKITKDSTTDSKKPAKVSIKPIKGSKKPAKVSKKPIKVSKSSKKPGSNRWLKVTRKYKCLMCDQMVGTKKELIIHIKNTHERKPNLCRYCNKQFRSREEYLEHSQTQEHKKNTPLWSFHNCPQCNYSGRNRQMLNTHINRVHLNIRPYKCDYCEKRYFDHRQLKEHVRIHTGQVRAKICDICGASLASGTALKKHRCLHTGDNPFSCSFCEVKTNCMSALKTHIMSKHMPPSIACPICGKLFHTMLNAKGHVKRTHWKSKEKFDYTKLKGLSPEGYEFFRDKRQALI